MHVFDGQKTRPPGGGGMVVNGSDGEGSVDGGSAMSPVSFERPCINRLGKFVFEGSVLQPVGPLVGGGFATPRPRLTLENLALFDRSPSNSVRH